MVFFSFYQGLLYKFFLFLAVFSYSLFAVDFYFPVLSHLPDHGFPFFAVFVPNLISLFGLTHLSIFLLFVGLGTLFFLGLYQSVMGSVLLYFYLCTYCNFLPLLPSPADGFLPYSILFAVLLFPANKGIFSGFGDGYSFNAKLFLFARLVFTSFYFIHGALSVHTWFNNELSFIQLYWDMLCMLYAALYWIPRTRAFSWVLFTLSLLIISPYKHPAFLLAATAVQIFMIDPRSFLFPRKKGLVYIDGFCVLCNGWAKFIAKEDQGFNLKITSIQGTYGKEHLSKKLQEEGSTIVLALGSSQYEKSGAVLRIFYMLGGVWTMLSIFLLLPPFVRDYLYDYVAKNRYRFFGRREVCSLPSELGSDRVLN